MSLLKKKIFKAFNQYIHLPECKLLFAPELRSHHARIGAPAESPQFIVLRTRHVLSNTTVGVGGGTLRADGPGAGQLLPLPQYI